MQETVERKPALQPSEYTPQLTAFEKSVWEWEDLWNGKEFGYTLEFSTGNDFFEEKSEILARSSDRLKRGVWRTRRCETCRNSSNGECGIHVEILEYLTFEEKKENSKLEIWMIDALEDKFPDGAATVNLDMLDELLATLPEGSNLFIELSLSIDKARESHQNAKKALEYL